MSPDYNEILAKIKESNKIAIISHVNPDADAYGSQLALAEGLRTLGKNVECLNESGVLDSYRFMPGVESVVCEFSPEGFDLAIACDCGDLKRLGDKFGSLFTKVAQTINIDHHVSNQRFATLNFVQENAAATSEIVFKILEDLKVEFSVAMCNCLLAGLMGDTGSFKYTNTSAETFEVAAKLRRRGGDSAQVAEDMFQSKPISAVKLQGWALNNLELSHGGLISWVILPEKVFFETGASMEDTEGLVELARNIQGVKISVLIRWDPDRLWKISMRAKGTVIDLSAVARQFGGGGHRAASAFRWRNTLEELREKLGQSLGELV